MAAAAPRLSDYEEFREYQEKSTGYDTDIIRVQMVIAQRIQRGDTPEHITDEFKTLCTISFTKITMYYMAVNNYYNSIQGTDYKVSFIVLRNSIGTFLRSITDDINKVKDSIIVNTKVTKDELQGYHEYNKCVRISRVLDDLLKKTEARIREIENKENAVRAEAAKRRGDAKAGAAEAAAKAALKAEKAEKEWLDFLKDIPYVVSRSGQTNEKDEFNFDFNDFQKFTKFVMKSLNMQIVNPLGARFDINIGKK